MMDFDLSTNQLLALAAVAGLLLVAVAGAVVFSDDAPEPPNDSPEDTPTSTVEGQPGEEYDGNVTPEDWQPATPTTPTGPSEASAFVNTTAHVAELEQAESFTVSMDMRLYVRNAQSTIDSTARVNLAEERIYATTDARTQNASLDAEQYADGGTTYVKQGNQYESAPTNGDSELIPLPVRSPTFDGFFGDLSKSQIRGYSEGPTVFDDEEMTRHQFWVTQDKAALQDIAVQPTMSPVDTQIASIEEVEVTLLVDDDGIIRQFRYVLNGQTADGKELTQEVTIGYSDIGNTIVPRPVWLSEAE